jgi:TusA-related sulfurtransferase
MNGETPIQPNVTLDLTGLTCPKPLLGAKQVMDDLKPGEVLMLISDCPGTKDDLFLWVKHLGNEIVKVEKTEAGHERFFIRKGKRPHYTTNVVLDIRGVSCPGWYANQSDTEVGQQLSRVAGRGKDLDRDHGLSIARNTGN